MGATVLIEKEDLGISVLGTPQCSYTVDGVHGQPYDMAVFRATLCRTAALEDLCNAYMALIRGRERKVDDLGTALASLYQAAANFKQGEQDPEQANLEVDSSAASILRRYGYTDASTRMSYNTISKMQEDVKYDIDQENNEMQQDVTQVQSYVSKRDDAFSTANSLMDKVGNTRSQGIKNIGS